MKKRFDRLLCALVGLLVLVGLFIFSSAALGLLNREGASFARVVVKQFLLLGLGLVLMLILARINYQVWRRWSLPLLIICLLGTMLVFVPQLGFSSGGARRWLSFGSFSIQPSEFLKLAVILFTAAWLAGIGGKVRTWLYGLLPFLLLVGTIGLILVWQPDLGTFIIIFVVLLSMFFIAGARWSHLVLILLVALIGFSAISYLRPYARERILAFINPENKTLSSAYQLNQSLIAIGAGGLTGRGFGQSVQKFHFLPEPIGDSIFAVAGEEFGLVGTAGLVTLFLLFSLWGLKIASRVADPFGRLLASGIVILIVTQAFANIAAMIGLIPLTGIPLLFVSHGGSALLSVLAGVGVVLNVSRQQRR